MTARIAFVVYPGFQSLDLAALGPFELANALAPEPVYEIETVALAPGLVASSAGIAVQARAFGRQPYDTVLVSGATGPTPTDHALFAELRRVAGKARRLAAICTGAFVLAEAGLLDGRRAATHWARTRELARRFPAIRVEDDRIFVNDDGVWTSAGMTACIDLALALVEEDCGNDIARTIARKLVVYHRRGGGQSQFSTLSELEPASDRIRVALAHARENLRAPLTVDDLAAVVHWSPRHFARAFRDETGVTPAKAVEKLRLEAAQALIEAGHDSIGRIAAESGFGDEDRMRRAFMRALGKPPQTVVREIRARMPAAPGDD
ncbi:GlxA family transcriptional regulator [Derxia gummosa]|uniref:GlxA family transcriptional regulator n=1 Tax=Derxia gummosa DSM 723 TaxID=1121388 RepID=A0A8B6X2M9_9BURK|nr:GlxA family transcriptional regulator [Derxia gummosa]